MSDAVFLAAKASTPVLRAAMEEVTNRTPMLLIGVTPQGKRWSDEELLSIARSLPVEH